MTTGILGWTFNSSPYSSCTYQAPSDQYSNYFDYTLTDGSVDGTKISIEFVNAQWEVNACCSRRFQMVGDNPTGLEIVLVWFRATDVGNTVVEYNDSSFTLQTVGEPEQRVAHLASLLPKDYGDQGSAPWLLPNEGKETSVPFLVTAHAQLSSFQYYFVLLQ